MASIDTCFANCSVCDRRRQARAQAQVVEVDAGHLVALRLTNHASGQTYFAFAEANGDKTVHLVNYGMNTWGFEDLHGGGDRDFNDLVVQLDFTSASGNAWLV